MVEIIFPLENWLAIGLILVASALSALFVKAKFQQGIEVAAKKGLLAHNEIDLIQS